MELTRFSLIARILYGALFMVVLPLGLTGWAIGTAAVVRLPTYQSTFTGIVLVAVGIFLMCFGMLALYRHGGGLPMNIFPPPHFVDRSVYRYLGQPIYIGFVVACGGAALIAGSASGLWLITPAAAAGAGALVLGHERLDLRRRFGERVHSPLLSLPRDSEERPGLWDRLAFALLVLLPWIIAYEAVQFMGIPRHAISSHLWFEHAWSVFQWTEIPYGSVYVLVLLTPFIVRTARVLRRMAITALLTTAMATIIYITVPLVAPPRPFNPESLLGHILASEQAFNHTVAAFPAFHVLWALIAAAAWPSGIRRRLAFVWALAITVSCVTTGMHSLADVAFALGLFPVLHHYRRVWSALRAGTEKLANSWREWHIGPVRVIVHGLYAALAGFVGMLIAGMIAGPDQTGGLLFVSFGSLAGAGLWAQRIEGSPALLRPFGFYGGLAGGLVGSFAAAASGYNMSLLLGAFSVALPWIQSLGRLRCLVQGCCHGGSASGSVGIRYTHPRSRVTQIAGKADVPLHPTPLYSILANIVVGILLTRLWFLSVPPTFVVGVYFLMNGLTRFVEESYRSEPQTPVIWGLHIYHWFAVACVAGGMALSSVHSSVPEILFNAPTPRLVVWALVIGLCAGFVMGVDFPRSNRRFARLAAVGQMDI